ncbi:MAG: rRNA adenine N-6-methyltransferase family protein [Gammaproteobacteria bacterium]
MATQHNTHKRVGTFLFIKEIFKNFSAMGAVIPTSSYAAREMAKQVSNADTGYVVELGAGSGVITEALVQHLADPKRLIVIEQSLELANYLQKRFPQLHVIHGDAAYLQTLLSDLGNQVSTIISALPFTLMSKAVVAQIGHQIETVLDKEGRLIQITYKSKKSSKFPQQFKLLYSKKVWRNIPPARIAVFEHQTEVQ